MFEECRSYWEAIAVAAVWYYLAFESRLTACCCTFEESLIFEITCCCCCCWFEATEAEECWPAWEWEPPPAALEGKYFER